MLHSVLRTPSKCQSLSLSSASSHLTTLFCVMEGVKGAQEYAILAKKSTLGLWGRLSNGPQSCLCPNLQNLDICSLTW